MGGYVRLLITVSICCCMMGFLMWLFMKCYKKASIWILLLCTGLLLVRFLNPHEFSFTHTIGVTIGYPTINRLLNQSVTFGKLRFPISHIIIGIWIIGIIVSAVHLLYHYCRLHMIIRRFPAAQDPVVLSQFDRILEERHFARSRFRIRESRALSSPFVTGLLHPVIVVPTLTLSQQEWYYVLSHETAHYLHGDTIYLGLIELLRVVFWWNPLFYLFHRKIGIYIEESADLLATELLDDMEKMEYLECLVKVAKQSIHNPLLSSSGLSFDGYTNSELTQRYCNVMESIDAPQTSRRKRGQYGFVAMMLLVTFLSYAVVIEPTSLDLPADEPNAFSIPTKGSYAIQAGDSLYELYIDNTYIGSFEDPATLPDIPIYEKEDLP